MAAVSCPVVKVVVKKTVDAALSVVTAPFPSTLPLERGYDALEGLAHNPVLGVADRVRPYSFIAAFS
jgi:hypothetical protein